ncbi:uncharacterized protein LOC126742324 [Anthonomus grandis grandis]|uniref:uncharacterized protein LOC126742324 n=1 Tax=Anthonomus grandis grandis TaxID=2921223 RepID=UPI0021652F1F|nr:uncharacterized protein LOC126742324 [Anthonomus grandis grandis]
MTRPEDHHISSNNITTMNFKVALCVVLCAAVASLHALPANEEARSNTIQTENDLLDAVYTDCLRKDSISCLKYKIYNFVDKNLGAKDTINVAEGVQIVKTGNGDTEGAPRAISSDDSIESLVFSRVARWLETHTFKVDLKGADIVNTVRSAARSFNDVIAEAEEEEATEEGRGKKHKKGGNKMMGPLMAAMALKAAVLGKLALWAIALLAGKALMIGKIALVLSSIIGIKKLLGSQNQGKHVTYEVVSHPQHSSSHVSTHEVTGYSGGSGHGGGYGGDVGGSYGGSAHGTWGRSIDAQQLAFRGQQPEQ